MRSLNNIAILNQNKEDFAKINGRIVNTLTFESRNFTFKF